MSNSKLFVVQDLNIGVALWLAAGGDGWLYEESEGYKPVKYKSKARILLIGSGADEQCAGYGRHKTKYRHGRCGALMYNARNYFMCIIHKLLWCQSLSPF